MADRSSRHDRSRSYRWTSARSGESVELLLPRVAEVKSGAKKHRVEAGDRLDLLAQRYFGDPFQYWRIVDANPAIAPGELMRPGTQLVIPPRT